jgi:hypothetical protein
MEQTQWIYTISSFSTCICTRAYSVILLRHTTGNNTSIAVNTGTSMNTSTCSLLLRISLSPPLTTVLSTDDQGNQKKMPTRNIVSIRHVTRTEDGFLKLEPLALLDDVIALSFGTGLPKTNSKEFDCWLFSLWSGLAQILMRPSRQIVRIDSLVNTRPERGSACTRWATRGESFGTSRILGEA